MVRRNLGLPHRLISKNFNCVIWVKTGLLSKTENDKGNMSITKYTDVDGIKFVEEMLLNAAGQEIKVKNSDIKINQPVSDDVFKIE